MTCCRDSRSSVNPRHASDTLGASLRKEVVAADYASRLSACLPKQAGKGPGLTT